MNAIQPHSAKACFFCATACTRTRNESICSLTVCALGMAAQARVDVGQQKSKSTDEVFRELGALALLAFALISPILAG